MHRGRRRSAWTLAILCSALGTLPAADASADAPAEPLAKRLKGALGIHPLADDSGRLALLGEVPAGVDASSLGLLPVAPGMGAVRLWPEEVEAFLAARPGLQLRVGPPRRLLLDESSEWTRVREFRAAGGGDGSSVKTFIPPFGGAPLRARASDVVIGVIDTGIDIFHADFRNVDGSTRIAWLLQSGKPRGRYPQLENDFGCTVPTGSECAIFGAADIDALIAAGEDDKAPGDLQGHGTHVASIAGGNGGLLRFVQPPGSMAGACLEGDGCDEGTCTVVGGDQKLCTIECKAGDCPEPTRCRKLGDDEVAHCVPDTPRYVGMAPGATLIVAAPSAGEGFQDPDILNAARFIFDRADFLGLPAVINLSVGGDFGPHDGTSLLEKGLAELVGEEHPGRAIVVAAGNSGALYRVGEGTYGVHTEATVSEHATTRVPIVTPASKNGQGFVWITFEPDDQVAVGLEGPDGDTWVSLVDPGEDSGYDDDDGTTAAVINALANGKSQLTSDTNGAVVAWDGAWEEGEFAILLRGRGNAQLWVVGQGDVGAASGGLFFSRALKQGTINVPASHPELLAVGCTVNRVRWTPLDGDPIQLAELGPEKNPTPDGICYFSSAGPLPNGWPKPEITAPGGFVAAAMSLLADPRREAGGLFDAPGCEGAEHCFVVDDYHAITAGSSMSAPHVAGAVALLLQRDPTLTQGRISEILQAGARYPSHPIPYDYQLGPGELDVVGAIAAMEAERDDDPVEPALSWYSLSSSYARADPDWPVWGTLELRRPDGGLASNVDPSRLAVEVRVGRLHTPLERVRHGLWRFAIAGREDRSGETIGLEVTYDGRLIPGRLEVPIGSDAWRAREDIDAIGGTWACNAAPGAARGWLGPMAAAAIWILLQRRRGGGRGRVPRSDPERPVRG